MSHRLAIDGGAPVRDTMLPYGHQYVDEADVHAVAEVLRSDWLTTGPKVEELERVFGESTGATEAVAVSSGTAALHAAMFALDIGPGDEVIVPAITFAATANCVVYLGGKPAFADVEHDTLLLDPGKVEAKITSRTRAIIAVDYAGQPCDYDTLREIANAHGLALVADACHALGGSYKGKPVGSLADLSTFSFHPVKHITAGEGGAITTDDPQLAQRMRIFRNHGIPTDHRQRAEQGAFFYEMVELGYNYRLTDIQCALALSQLGKLPRFVCRRQAVAARYDAAFSEVRAVQALAVQPGVSHAYHLYVTQFDLPCLRVGRTELFGALRAENIGVNVHYIPVYWHPFYRRLGYQRGTCPVAEAAYERLVSLPMYYGITDQDVDHVITAVEKVVAGYLA